MKKCTVILFLVFFVWVSLQQELFSSQVKKNVIGEFFSYNNNTHYIFEARTRSRYGYTVISISPQQDNFTNALVIMSYILPFGQIFSRFSGLNSSIPLLPIPLNLTFPNLNYKVEDINDYPFGYFVNDASTVIEFPNTTNFNNYFGNIFWVFVGTNNVDYPNSMTNFKIRYDESIFFKVNLSETINGGLIYLNPPYPRLEILHPAVYAVTLFYYFVTFIFLILFSRNQPLLSRSSTPFIGCIAQFLHLLSDIAFFFITYENNTYYCVVQYIFQYSFLLIIILTSLLHFFRYVVLINFAQKKKLVSLRNDEGKVNAFFLILKYFERWYVNVVLVISFFILVSLIFLATFIGSSFVCSQAVNQYVYVALVILLITFPSSFLNETNFFNVGKVLRILKKKQILKKGGFKLKKYIKHI